MVANRMESPTGGGGTDKGEASAGSAREAGAPAQAGGGGGLQTWLPLIITLISMPLLAYATTTFLILPKLQQSLQSAGESASAEPADSAGSRGGESKSSAKEPAAPASGGHGAKAAGAKEGAVKGKPTAVFSKVLVNVAGTMGSRYIMTSFTLVASNESARNRIEESRDLLLDLSSSALGAKTLSDLEKPGWRNLLRAELVSVFNDALGKGTVQEIFLTEFAIQ
jgi:flagellar protein FliL